MARSMSAGLDHGLVALNIDDECLVVQIFCRFRQTVGATRMVMPGHNSGPAEPLDGIGDSLIVGGDQDPVHEFGLLDTPIDVLDQWSFRRFRRWVFQGNGWN